MLLPTRQAGDATELAAQAVVDGFDVVVAAGGDGTLNEAVNGLAPSLLNRHPVRFGALPLGTANVFALEHRLPLNLAEAWQVVLNGRERAIDLGRAAYRTPNGEVTRYFLQMAGAGLDAHAVYLVDWRLKKRLGKAAYALAALKAWRQSRDRIEVRLGSRTYAARWVLVGNGAYYGGNYRVFPRAQTDDGQLDVCLFERLDVFLVLRGWLRLLRGGALAGPGIRHLQGEAVAIRSDPGAHLELDGEYAGTLPATFSVLPRALRLLCP